MDFREFEKRVWEKGYGIVAMNHYTIGGKRYTYCVVLSRNKERAFQSEAQNSEEAFENIFNQIINYEKEKTKSLK